MNCSQVNPKTTDHATNQIVERLAALERRAEKSEASTQADQEILARTRRQLRVTWAVSALAAVTMLTLGWHKDAIAQGYTITLAQAATRIAALEAKTQDMTRVNDPNTKKTTVRFSGVNVQIVDGTGATGGTQTGLGNLIIGYNERRDDGNDARTGNHNLIAGVSNNYSGNGGVVFGYQNNISYTASTVTGGTGNTATANYTNVSGGYGNTAYGVAASVSGGILNTASNECASVSGGSNNMANSYASSVSGGYQNAANSDYASVSGGQENAANGPYSSVSGGSARTLIGDSSWAGGTYISR